MFSNAYIWLLCSLSELDEMVSERWDWMRRPIHGIAALLHPLYNTEDTQTNAALQTARTEYLAQVYDEDQQYFIDMELAPYYNGMGAGFSTPVARRRESCLRPVQWWENHGFATPHLRTLALRVLSQVHMFLVSWNCLFVIYAIRAFVSYILKICYRIALHLHVRGYGLHSH